MKLSKKIQEIQHSPIRKFYAYAEQAKAQGKKVYHLNIGQPDIKTPSVFFDAMHNIEGGVLAYSPSEGTKELREAIRDYYKRYGMDYDVNDIIITSGGSEAITFTMNTILDEGDEVIIAEPYYTNYMTFLGMAGGKAIPIPTKAEEGYHYASREKIESRITEKTKAIIIVNPGNPTGNILTREEMRMICDVAKEHGLYVVSDEVYREFIYGGEEMTSFGQFEDASENVIVIDSISKRFSACGARIGSIASKNKDFMNNVLKLCQGRLCAPTMDQMGAAALYKLDPSYFNEIRDEYASRRDAVFNELSKIEGIVCQLPKGAFYMTVKLPVENAEGFYGTPGLGRDEMRIAYVLKEEDMIRGAEIIRIGLEEYKKRSKNEIIPNDGTIRKY